MIEYPFIPYKPHKFNSREMLERSEGNYDEMRQRRSVREFSPELFDLRILENAVLAAGTAPSGANKQPWTFCIVTNSDLKRKIRLAAEKEEHENYTHRMSESWLRDLAPLGTDEKKEFLETAPALIVVFRRSYEFDANGGKQQNYYVQESVGIACGFLIAAIHRAGLCCLTHTPSPMNFLEKILERPENERAYLLIPVGFAAEDATVPDILRKPLETVLKTYI